MDDIVGPSEYSSFVAGLRDSNADGSERAWLAAVLLKSKDYVDLVPDPDHARRMTAVWIEKEGYTLGYLPPRTAIWVYDRLHAGKPVKARVQEIKLEKIAGDQRAARVKLTLMLRPEDQVKKPDTIENESGPKHSAIWSLKGLVGT